MFKKVNWLGFVPILFTGVAVYYIDSVWLSLSLSFAISWVWGRLGLPYIV